MKTIIGLVAAMIVAMTSFTQDNPANPKTRDYSAVDSFVTSTLQDQKRYSEVEILIDTIKKNFSEESDRVRAIFIWVTDNIAYDCKKYHSRKNPKPKKRRWGNKGTPEAQRIERAKECFKKKEGTCTDYSLLIKHLCNLAGIECEIVRGYAVNPDKRKGKHSWNKVKIADKWYYLDATWASGYVDRKITTFTKKLNDFYFLPDPEEFKKTHLEK